MLHEDTRFFLNDTAFTATQLIDLKNVDPWLVAVQRVVKFCLFDEVELDFQTSGSTGNPKQIIHPRERLKASAKATIDFFDLRATQKALLVLPAHLTGGAMMIIRACLGGLHLYLQKPTADPVISSTMDFVPLTPAQFIRTKESGSFEGFDGVVLLGGSAVPTKYDVDSDLRVFAGFGMTETASHVALRKLGSPYYEAVGPTTFSVDEEGALSIHAPHLDIPSLKTKDLVDLKSSSSFKHLGRANLVINAGGIKIHPEPLERWLETHGIQAWLVGSEDEVFGEVPVLVCESKDAMKRWSIIKNDWPTVALKKALLVSDIPIAAGGKVDRAALKELVKSHRDHLYPLE